MGFFHDVCSSTIEETLAGKEQSHASGLRLVGTLLARKGVCHVPIERSLIPTAKRLHALVGLSLYQRALGNQRVTALLQGIQLNRA